ncbi:MAG TPA: SIS domain-containing protein [Kofleriaceae bacterium]|nr:SIS domain-containing protein [Kofleriaceae bacterium]
MTPLEEIYAQSPDPVAYARGYLRRLTAVLAAIDPEAIARAAEVMWRAREEGRRIFFIGNGGSAATASHFANDIGIGTRSDGPPFKALSLTDNNAVLTCLANDLGYESVFVEQLRLHLEPGDVVVAISASGNSPNVLRAVDFARERGNATIGFTGFDGGELRKRAQLAIHVPTERGEYGPVEDAHMVLDHLISTYLAMRARRR